MGKHTNNTDVQIVKMCRKISDLHTRDMAILTREVEMANKRTQDVAKAADNYMAAVLYWDDFMDSHPDPEYYDKDAAKEFKRLTKAKWKAYDELKKYIDLVFSAKK